MKGECVLSFIVENPEVIIWGIIIAIVLFSNFVVGVNYISLKDIIKNYIGCFRNSRSKKIMLIPIMNYICIPFLMGLSIALIKEIDEDIINIITIIISILTAMLFTLLAMVIEMRSKIRDDPQYYSSEANISKKALQETYYAIMFEILVSVFLLIACFFNIFTNVFNFFQSFVIYGLSFLLIINLLIIIKRIFRVIDTDMGK